jgi:hypothetical protein
MLATVLAITLAPGATRNPYLERAKRLAERLEFRRTLGGVGLGAVALERWALGLTVGAGAAAATGAVLLWSW